MMAGFRIEPILVVLCWLLTSQAASGEEHRKPIGQLVAIWQLRSMGLEAQRSQQVRSAISRAFARTPDWTLLSDKTLRARLRRAGLDARSPVERVAPALGIRFLITGTLAGLGDQTSLDIKLLTSTGRQLRRAAVEIPGDPVAADSALDELLVRLLDPQRWVGSLALEVSEAQAHVFLDGTEVASTPLAGPLSDLAPGKHILMIRKEGFGEFSKFVFVRCNQVARLKVDLASATVVGLLYERRDEQPKPAPEPAPVAVRQPAPPPAQGANWQQIVGWTCLGLGAAVAGAGGLLGLYSQELEGQAERGWWTVDNADRLQSLQADGQHAARWANRAFIIGGALAAVSAGFLLWGYLTGDPGFETATGTAPAARLGPAPVSGGLGLGLSGRF